MFLKLLLILCISYKTTGILEEFEQWHKYKYQHIRQGRKCTFSLLDNFAIGYDLKAEVELPSNTTDLRFCINFRISEKIYTNPLALFTTNVGMLLSLRTKKHRKFYLTVVDIDNGDHRRKPIEIDSEFKFKVWNRMCVFHETSATRITVNGEVTTIPFLSDDKNVTFSDKFSIKLGQLGGYSWHSFSPSQAFSTPEIFVNEEFSEEEERNLVCNGDNPSKNNRLKNMTLFMYAKFKRNLLVIKEDETYSETGHISDGNFPCVIGGMAFDDKKLDIDMIPEALENEKIIYDNELASLLNISYGSFYSGGRAVFFEKFMVNTELMPDVCSKEVARKIVYVKNIDLGSYHRQERICKQMNGKMIGEGGDERRQLFYFMNYYLEMGISVYLEKSYYLVGDNRCISIQRLEYGRAMGGTDKTMCDNSQIKEMICQIPEDFHLRMRHTPRDSEMVRYDNKFTDTIFQIRLEDHHFNLTSRMGDRIFLKESKIFFISATGQFYEAKTLTGKLFGRYEWYAVGSGKNNSEFTSILTTCKDNEYTCNNGDCISLERRCNGIVDCMDKSDEKCNKVLEDMSNSLEEPTNETFIEIEIECIGIEDIGIDEHSIRMRIMLTTSWHDSRVTLIQLDNLYEKNIIMQDQIEWKPVLMLPIANFKDILKHEKGEFSKSFMYASKTQEVKETIHNGQESYIYNAGKEAKLEFKEEFMGDFDCNMDFKLFPFDVHMCSIKISIQKSPGLYNVFFNSTTVYIIPNQLSHHLFDISQLKVRTTTKNPRFLTFTILLSRRYTAFILTTIFPCIMIGLLGSLTHLFDKDDFSNRIMVTLSNLIVLASLFSTFSGSYPPSAEAKCIDIIYFFYIFKVSIDFILHTCARYIYREDRRKQGRSQMEKIYGRNYKKSNFTSFDSIALWVGLSCELVFVAFYLLVVGYDRQTIINEFENI